MKKKRYSAEDWLDLGLTELSRTGPEAIKLEAICKAAGLTRGSFYYHFADHEAFLVAMANRWLEQQTDEIAEHIQALMDGGEISAEVMEQMTQAALKIDYRLELAMRELGRRVPKVNVVVNAADKKRIGVMTQIYVTRYALPMEEAARYAYLEYATFSGIVLLNPDMAEDEQLGLAALYEQTMVAALRNGD